MASTNAHLWGDLADDEAAAALLASAMSTIDSRVDYGDARLVEAEELRLYHQLDRDPDERLEKSIGIGVRVLVDGSWGFAAAPLSDAAVPARTAERAIAVARAGVGAGPRVVFPPRPAASGRYQTEVGQDPFAVTTAERDALLAQAIEAAAASRGVSSVTAGVNAKRQHRHFASTEGSLQHQHLIETGGGLTAIAANAREVQRRSYPNSFHGNTGGSGWEFVLGLDLVGNGARVGEEAVALLSAPMAPAGVNDLVIGAQQVSLQIHESSGHALELDRILGDERNFAGTSFIQASDVGTLRYGSPAVSITSDPTVAGTRGSFGWDDEGTPARRAGLIEEGIFRRTLSNRDSAARAGLEITGAARGRRLGLPAGLLLHPRVPRAGPRQPAGAARPARRRLLHRGQPQLVDRQPAAQLPVRHRGRLRGAPRPQGTAAAQLQLRRDHAAVLEQRRGRRGPGRVPDLRLPLRQGRAEAVGFPQPRGGAAAGPRDQDRSRMMLPPLNEARTMEALDAALRSTAADEFEISVLARSGEYTRFAGQVIHQPQDIAEVQYLVRALVNGHPYRVATSTAADLERAVAAAAAGARTRAELSKEAGQVRAGRAAAGTRYAHSGERWRLTGTRHRGLRRRRPQRSLAKGAMAAALGGGRRGGGHARPRGHPAAGRHQRRHPQADRGHRGIRQR